MKEHVTALERAFELASSGLFSTIEEIKRKLNAEGYHGSHLTGRQLTKQLRDKIEAARPKNGRTSLNRR
jgi:hypothetical protein